MTTNPTIDGPILGGISAYIQSNPNETTNEAQSVETTAFARGLLQFLEELHMQQQARGFVPRTKEEIDASIEESRGSHEVSR